MGLDQHLRKPNGQHGEHKAQDKTQTTENTTQYRKLRRLAAQTEPPKTMW